MFFAAQQLHIKRE